jgi:hypothetical protein
MWGKKEINLVKIRFLVPNDHSDDGPFYAKPECVGLDIAREVVQWLYENVDLGRVSVREFKRAVRRRRHVASLTSPLHPAIGQRGVFLPAENLTAVLSYDPFRLGLTIRECCLSKLSLGMESLEHVDCIKGLLEANLKPGFHLNIHIDTSTKISADLIRFHEMLEPLHLMLKKIKTILPQLEAKQMRFTIHSSLRVEFIGRDGPDIVIALSNVDVTNKLDFDLEQLKCFFRAKFRNKGIRCGALWIIRPPCTILRTG